MPIRCQYPFRAMDREEFGRVSYGVMKDLFEIHNEMGRFFDESIYKQALAAMRDDVLLEVWIEVTHDSFRKVYFIDVVVGQAGVFEFKAVEVLAPRHRGQLLHYLMLAELLHGMLVNVRPGKVEREFVNNAMPIQERLRFDVRDVNWTVVAPAANFFRETLLAILKDWGTGLELALYEEALTHFLGGKEKVERRVDVFWRSEKIGRQPFRLADPRTAFKLTAFEDADAQTRFAEHAQRLVNHVDLDALLWANVAKHCVSFATVRAEQFG